MPIARQFKLFVRCECCRRESSRVIDVPDVEDAPTDVEELLCSTLLERQVFDCRECHGTIGLITGVATLEAEAA
ncbi:hypothetical protein ABLE91_05600 [Aquabacter sp. CN5-332]|uniref:hypothetical protein n=1 Tax=Aquabacter sp. CN5-332 TaxID=3156608 RepID=UPI0032B315E0